MEGGFLTRTGMKVKMRANVGGWLSFEAKG